MDFCQNKNNQTTWLWFDYYGLLGHTLYACVALGYHNVRYPFCSTIIPLLLSITSCHINILM
ncbi:hypothetical protein Hanom_Chr01g00046081 [Helianthus anomalus]